MADGAGSVGGGDGAVVLAEGGGLVALVENAFGGGGVSDLFLIFEFGEVFGFGGRQEIEELGEGFEGDSGEV